jgi:formamidopyrimidine-DNA glycosylase
MPELPEVETICNELRSHVINKHVKDLNRLTAHNLRRPIPLNIKAVIGASIVSIVRRAKYIQVSLSNDLVLIMHLGMSGKILLKNFEYIPQKHDHLMIDFNDGQKLIYHDPRRFGLVDLIRQDELTAYSLFKNLGIEPFSKDFTSSYLANLLSGKKKPIKLAIMDNANIVGVGNIYASESLFLAKVSPTRVASSLTGEEVKLLHKNILYILDESIKKGGSTLKDYANVNGEKGYFQNSFKVYGRDKNPCAVCKIPIEKITQGGRSSFYCSSCQK